MVTVVLGHTTAEEARSGPSRDDVPNPYPADRVAAQAGDQYHKATMHCESEYLLKIDK